MYADMCNVFQDIPYSRYIATASPKFCNVRKSVARRNFPIYKFANALGLPVP